MMKVIDRRADRRAPPPGHDRPERIRQGRLARAVDAIDADADDPFRMQAGDQDREAAQQRCVGFAHIGLSRILKLAPYSDISRPPSAVILGAFRAGTQSVGR